MIELKSHFSDTRHIDEQIGHNVRECRKSSGKNQQYTASLMGISFQQLQKYETGKNRISASRLFQLSQIFDVPITRFFINLPGDEIKAQSNSMLQHRCTAKESDQISRLFASITDDELKRRLILLLRQLVAMQKAREYNS
jgi:transcriptional regulator with XRE-family HTH domain